MFTKISKSDVLQSIGFAETAATEECERLTGVISAQLQELLTSGVMVPTEVQGDMSRALIAAREQLEKIKLLRRMAEFERDDSVLLDAASFAILEPNLPGR